MLVRLGSAEDGVNLFDRVFDFVVDDKALAILINAHQIQRFIKDFFLHTGKERLDGVVILGKIEEVVLPLVHLFVELHRVVPLCHGAQQRKAAVDDCLAGVGLDVIVLLAVGQRGGKVGAGFAAGAHQAVLVLGGGVVAEQLTHDFAHHAHPFGLRVLLAARQQLVEELALGDIAGDLVAVGGA